ncbi:MAG: NAD(P)-dependent oxidoreductase [Acidobacteria bacterium]|nr:NAD(P)-dependent oxidoreductase [Acidobacteriota bacterium]
MTALSLNNVAITGATGFIGRHLVEALVVAGYRPLVISRAWARPEPLAALGDRVRWAQADLIDNDALRSVLEREPPTVVFHLAGTLGRGEATRAVIECVEGNLFPSVRMLEAAMRLGVTRLILIGSAEEYGDYSGPFHEDLRLRPLSPYGVSKAAATQFALAMHARTACPVVIVRPFTAYGPAQPKAMFVAEAVDCAIKNVPFRMSQGNQRRDLVYVTDVVRGLLAAATTPGIEGRVINLGSGHAYRLRDVAERIWDLTGTSAPLLVGARHASADQLYDTWADIGAARVLIGWEPTIGLDDGLRATIAWAREQRLAPEGPAKADATQGPAETGRYA